MSETTLVERLREQKNQVKEELVKKAGEITALKQLFTTVLDDAYSPVTMATDDLTGGFLGWGLWRGGKWLYNKAGQVDAGKPPGFLQRNGWLNDLMHVGISATTYAVNLAIPYQAPMSLGREIVRRAAVTQFFFALDSGVEKLFTKLATPKPPAAPPTLPPTPAPTPAKK